MLKIIDHSCLSATYIKFLFKVLQSFWSISIQREEKRPSFSQKHAVLRLPEALIEDRPLLGTSQHAMEKAIEWEVND